jgi:hypothetical protein
MCCNKVQVVISKNPSSVTFIFLENKHMLQIINTIIVIIILS